MIPIFGIEAFHQGDSLDANGSVLRAIDRSGMSIPDSNDPSTWTVSSNAWADDWQGFAPPTAGTNNTWAVIDLGAPAASIETMYLWNVQEGITAPGNGQWARGTNEFIVHTATAPTVTLPLVSGAATPYDFSSGGWTAFGGARTLAQANGTVNEPVSGTYDLTGIGPTRYLGIQILSNHGGIAWDLHRWCSFPPWGQRRDLRSLRSMSRNMRQTGLGSPGVPGWDRCTD